VLPQVRVWNDVVKKYWNATSKCNAKKEARNYPFGLNEGSNIIEIRDTSVCNPDNALYANIELTPQKKEPIIGQKMSISDPLTQDAVMIYCAESSDPYFFTWPLRKDLETKKSQIKGSKPYNILGIGFDSMSHANYLRNLPKTMELMRTRLNKTGNLFELNGYTIVGDGTTANLGGILTGEHEFYLPEARKKITNSSTVDSWPWIWKEAEALGYVTAFLEDEPNQGAFTLRLNGFQNPPTDYYFLQLWQALGSQSHTSFTYGRYNWERQLDYGLNIFKLYPEHPIFSFIFSKISHTHCLADLSKFDEEIASIFEKYFDLPQFENTLFFLFGDHGMRFGDFRQTLEGKIEERLPGMFIKVPDRFAKEHPAFIQNIRINQDRLTTPFDVNAALKDILYDPVAPTYSEHQKSLLTQVINPERKCSEALIADHWCTCQSGRIVEVTPLITKGTERLVEELNKRLIEHGENKCEVIQLSKVTRAELLTFEENMVGFVKSSDEDGRVATITDKTKQKLEQHTQTYQVQFEIRPGGGLLEGDFSVTDENDITIGHHFSRVNSYGYLPCQPKPLIREFCVCKNRQEINID
jgi:hypothetical protein